MSENFWKGFLAGSLVSSSLLSLWINSHQCICSSICPCTNPCSSNCSFIKRLYNFHYLHRYLGCCCCKFKDSCKDVAIYKEKNEDSAEENIFKEETYESAKDKTEDSTKKNTEDLAKKTEDSSKEKSEDSSK